MSVKNFLQKMFMLYIHFIMIIVSGSTITRIAKQLNIYKIKHENKISNNLIEPSIIYYCKNICGGHGDRLKGMISLFWISFVLDRPFFIIHNKVVKWEEYYVPNKINWIFPKTKKNIRSVMLLNYIDIPLNVKYIKKRNETLLINHNLFDQKNIEEIFHQIEIKNLSRKKQWQLFNVGYHFLFKVSSKIINILKNITMVQDFIGIHIRFGKGMDWEDPERTLINDITIFEYCVKKIQEKTKITKIFITSDREDGIKYFLNKQYNIILNNMSMITHTDRSPYNSIKDGFIRTVLDHLILSESYLIINSASGFSYTSAFIGSMDPIIYDYKNCQCRTENDFY